jgi:hypothetical protein
MKGTKRLIAYFSRTGDNYVNGSIVNLPVGNTEVAAGIIRKLKGPHATVLTGLSIRGGSVLKAEKDISACLGRSGIPI